MSTLYIKAINSVKWSALIAIIPRIISPLVMIALARILAPESFGLVSIALIVISFSQMFWEAGLSHALIQTNEPILKVANVVFWSNITLGVVIYCIIFFAAPTLSIYFNSAQSMPVLRVLSVQIIIMSLAVVQEGLLNRDFDFRSLFWIKIITTLLPGLFSIILALYGYKVWALVYGTLLGSLLNVLLLWGKSTWRPSMQIHWYLVPKLFRFGFWMVSLSLLGWLINWLDSILVSKYLGIAELGIYRTGITMNMMLFSMVIGPISTIIFPAFSRIQDNRGKVIKYFNDANKIIMSIALPAGVGLFLVSNALVAVVYGEKWKGMGVVLGVMGLSEAIANCVSINTTIYQAIGRPDLQPKLSIFLLPFFIIAYLYAAPLGMGPLLWAKLGLTLLTAPINALLVARVLKISPFYIFHQGKYIIISTLILATSVLATQGVINVQVGSNYNIIVLSGSIFAGVISYVVSIWFLDRPFCLQIQSLIKSTFANLRHS